jgi:hypothetical protein
MRESHLGSRMKAGHHRRALAAIHFMSKQRDFGQLAQALQFLRTGRRAAIVHEHNGQILGAQRRHHAADRALMVVHRNDNADVEHGNALGDRSFHAGSGMH